MALHLTPSFCCLLFSCSHCYDQKEDFGAQAMADFPYVECFPEGWQKVRVHAWLWCGALWVVGVFVRVEVGV